MRYAITLAALAVALAPSAIFGQNPTPVSSAWNAGFLNWNSAGNWSPAVIPNNNANNVFNVTIDNNAGPTLDTNAEINSLSIGANTGQNSALIDNLGFTLMVDQDASNNGVIPLAAGGALVVKGDLVNSGERGSAEPNNQIL